MALRDGSPEDYGAAAIRHYEDAAALAAKGQFDNAGHLIGFAAECAIKHRIGTTGQAEVYQHLPDILPAARRRLGSRSNFVGMFNLLKGDVLKGWYVDQRYSRNQHIAADQFESWHKETQRLLAAAGFKVRQK